MLEIAIAVTVIFISFTAFAEDCSPQGAYVAGYNDGKINAPMQSHYAAGCPGNLSQLNWRYIAGYRDAASTNKRSNPPQQCINNFGSQACGYHCVQVAFKAQCASKPDQMCMADQMGDIACGYNCVATMSEVKCATSRKQSCVADPFSGHVNCQ
jgi:hypothetical protein